eukprot:scaffold26560_cov79-Isochrysis_galbana.AAC.1
MITNKHSNIVEDLDTLRLFAQASCLPPIRIPDCHQFEFLTATNPEILPAGANAKPPQSQWLPDTLFTHTPCPHWKYATPAPFPRRCCLSFVRGSWTMPTSARTRLNSRWHSMRRVHALFTPDARPLHSRFAPSSHALHTRSTLASNLHTLFTPSSHSLHALFTSSSQHRHALRTC